MLQNVRKKQHEVKNMESLLDAKRQVCKVQIQGHTHSAAASSRRSMSVRRKP